jgi:integrase
LDDLDIERLAAAVAAKLAPAPRASLTWAQLWDIYEPREVPKLESPAVQRSMGRHLVRLLGTAAVAETTSDTVVDYRIRRSRDITKRRRKPSPKTINNEIILIRRLARWAANQRPPLIERDPLAGATDLLVPVQNVRLNVVDDRPDSDLSLAAFISRADRLERAMVLVAHSSGIRRRELAVLDRSWVDHARRLITIPPGISKGRRGKKRGRTTIVSQEALDALSDYWAHLPAPVYFSRWAFVNERTQRHYSPDFFTRRWRRLELRVGVDGPSGSTWLHDLRRSFVTLARKRGEDAVRVMKLAGHSTLSSQERYHVDSDEEVMRSRDRIEQARAEALAEPRRGPHMVAGCVTPASKSARQ